MASIGFAVGCLGIGKNKTSEDEPNLDNLVEAPRPDIDQDGDGLVDSYEQQIGSDPLNPDTDDDGWLDGEEVDNFTDPLDASDHPYTGGWPIDSCRHDVEGTGNYVGGTVRQFELTDQFGDAVKVHDWCNKAVLLVSDGGFT